VKFRLSAIARRELREGRGSSYGMVVASRRERGFIRKIGTLEEAV
jgi:hypothetical protein